MKISDLCRDVRGYNAVIVDIRNLSQTHGCVRISIQDPPKDLYVFGRKDRLGMTRVGGVEIRDRVMFKNYPLFGPRIKRIP